MSSGTVDRLLAKMDHGSPCTAHRKGFKRTRAAMFRAQHGKCYLCGVEMVQFAPPHMSIEYRGRLRTFDHVYPRKLTNAPAMSRARMYGALCCQKCNGEKGSRNPYPCELVYVDALLTIMGIKHEVRP